MRMMEHGYSITGEFTFWEDKETGAVHLCGANSDPELVCVDITLAPGTKEHAALRDVLHWAGAKPLPKESGWTVALR